MVFGRKQDEIESLTRANDLVQQRAEDAERLLETAHGIAGEIIEELSKPEVQGALEEEARAIARVAIEATERERIKHELAEKLRDQEYDKHAADVRIQDGSRIKSELHGFFQTDGTYEKIHEKAAHDVRVQLQQEVMDEHEARVREELDTPENRDRFMAEVHDEVRDSEELISFSQRTREELESNWREQTREVVKAEIVAEEELKEDKFKDEYALTYEASKEGKRVREEARARLEKEWKEKTAQDVAEAIQDEELQNLLTKKAEQEKRALRDEVLSEEMRRLFEGRGIDMTTVEEGLEVIIQLGTVGSVIEKDRQKGDAEKSAIFCKRTLTLTALGGGKFVVDADSLHMSESPYEREFSLQGGTIVVLGRKLSENGDRHIDQRIAADVPLVYDDDTSSPDFKDSLLPVANISIDGIVARKFDKVETS